MNAEWRTFYDELQGDSDRACAIVGAAVLDANLENLLRSYLVEDTQELNNLLNAGNDFAPLRDFGARITLAYLIGAVDGVILHDLRVIKNVRNLFAHEHAILRFSSNPIIRKVRQLKVPDMITSAILRDAGIPSPGPAPKDRFVWTITTLLGELQNRRDALAKSRLKPAPAIQVSFRWLGNYRRQHHA